MQTLKVSIHPHVQLHAHVKDPVGHVRVWRIMETLRHLTCTVGWVVRLSQLPFPREGNLNIPWEKSPWDNTVAIKKRKKEQKTPQHSMMVGQINVGKV